MKLKDFFETIKLKDIDERSEISRCKARTTVSVILCLAAAVMMVLNFKNNSMVMAYSSVVLVAGFLVSAFFSGLLKKSFASGVIIALLVGFVLSVFALTGGNEGFAILWVLLVPLFSISLLGVVPGLVVSTYFMVFLFVIFATPIKVSMADKYSSSFISRFPVLYMCDYAIATFFSLQRVYYHKKLEYQAYSDGLTGLYNRRYFMENLLKYNNENEYSIIMVDLNGLKRVNDELGHESGDKFICCVSDLLKKEFTDKAKICRIGGDEIAIISHEKSDILEEKINQVKYAADELSKDCDFKISFSVGMAHNLKDDFKTPEKLLRLADKNMYKNKMDYYNDSANNRRKR